MNKENYYYDIRADLETYPECWLYCVVGGRNTGKTYSALRYCYEEGKKFVFIKRTMDDVDLLCSGSGKIGQQHNEYGVDFSPFKSLNRDMGWNIRAFSIRPGIGGFWECNDNNEPEGLPVGYLFALSAVSKYKGFDLSECDYIIFDEFIAPKWDRVSKTEGDQLLELYKTVSRDREHRGREQLRILALANATNISNPLFNTTEITNEMVRMQIFHINTKWIQERGIFLHLLQDNEEFQEKEKKSMIYKAMGDTAWGQMALSSEFAYDDFTSIRKKNLKNHRCLYRYRYKRKWNYVYKKDNEYYVTTVRNNKYLKEYDLDIENDQKLFFIEKVIDLRNYCVDGKVTFSDYTQYDLIVNYKKFFKL